MALPDWSLPLTSKGIVCIMNYDLISLDGILRRFDYIADLQLFSSGHSTSSF